MSFNKTIAFFFILLSTYTWSVAQSTDHFSNEWIEFSNDYYKFTVSENGIYRITHDQLVNFGIASSDLEGNILRVFNNGIQIPIIVSTEGRFSTGDYLEFYGEKNTIQLDSFLFDDWQNELLNTEYSFFSDESAYFLTLGPSEDLVKRYETYDYNFEETNLSIKNYYLHDEKVVYTDRWYKPDFSNSVQLSNFIKSEGYAGKLTNSSIHSLDVTNLRMDVSDEVVLSYRLGSNGNAGQGVLAKLNNIEIGSENHSAQHSIFQNKYVIDKSIVQESNSLVLDNTGNVNGKHRAALVSLTYPRDLDANGESQFYFDHLGGDEIFKLSSLVGENQLIYDVDNGLLLPSKIEGEDLLFNVNSQVSTSLYILSNSVVRKGVHFVSKIKFNDYSALDPDLIFLTSRRLESKLYNGQNIIDKYASYRRSDIGGSHNLEIVYIEDLYNQFGYGVDFHQVVYPNFNKFIDSIWTKLESAFIIGKSHQYFNMRTRNNLDDAKYFVPTFGEPGSDALMFSSDKYPTSNINVGRIAVSTQEDLSNYLDKVQRYENLPNLEHSIENDFWKKSIIHLSGGGNSGEQTSIANYLSRMDDEINQSKFGGNVKTFYKVTTDVLQTISPEQLNERINDGVSMITFFGHSSVGTFDVGLDDPSEYNNKERLPIITSLGCYSGNINTPNGGISERYVLYKDQGSIGFLASAGSAYLNQQGVIGREMYEILGNEGYGKPFANALKILRQKYGNTDATSYLSLFQQFTYHGDPLITLQHYDLPDYTLDEQSFKTNPEKIISIDTQFYLEFDLVNLGQASVTDSVEILVINKSIESSRIDSLLIYIEVPKNTSKISIPVPLNGPDNRGSNSISIKIDPNNKIIEGPNPLAENNNNFGDVTSGTFDYFVLDNAVSLISPNNFGIMINDNQEVIFSTSNALADYEDFILEVDTTIYFDSHSLYSASITARGGIIRHKIESNLTFGTVYYWRVSKVSDLKRSLTINSFTFDPGGKPGWRQGHYYQFLENPESSISMNASRKWEFGVDRKEFKVDLGIDRASNTQLFVNGVNWASLHPTKYQEAFCVFTRNENPKKHFLNSADNSFGSYLHSIGDIFIYKMDKEEDIKNIKDLLNTIPDGNSIYIYTYLLNENSDLKTSRWASDSINLGYNIYSLLEDYGASKVRGFDQYGTVPYLFSFVKGGETTYEEIGTSIDYRLTKILDFKIRNTSGHFTSSVIGPGKSWKEVIIENDDQMKTSLLSVKGLDRINKEFSFIERQPTDNPTEIYSVNEYGLKNIQLTIDAEDTADRTPPKYSSIKVTYEPSEELALHFTEEQFNANPSVHKGEVIVVEGYVHNLTNIPSTPCQLNLNLDDRANHIINYVYDIPSIASHDSTLFKIEFESTGFSADIQLEYILNKTKEPIEGAYLNNFASVSIPLQIDRQNPIIDILFDGVHIRNEDFVSESTLISIDLIDENPYLLLDDPNILEVQITDEIGNTTNYSITEGNLKFSPAISAQSNIARFMIEGSFDEGTHSMVVHARDISKNSTGENPIEIVFNIKKINSISKIEAYPNPFQNITFFNFTITGQLPQTFEFLIFDTYGKVVKNIKDTDLKIGENIRTITWNGTDNNGSLLPSGIYYYKVIFDSDYSLFTPSLSMIKFKEIYNKIMIQR